MCVVKTPKLPSTSTADKPLPVLRNPYLDGMSPEIKALRKGRSALRIDPIRSQHAPTPIPANNPAEPPLVQLNPPPTVPIQNPPVVTPRLVGGGGSVRLGNRQYVSRL